MTAVTGVQALQAFCPAASARILKLCEAVAYLEVAPECLCKARCPSRLFGVRINEKAWGFRQSELTRYLTCYNCQPAARTAVPALRVAYQPRRHRRHSPAPKLGAAQCRARPHPNRLLGAGGLDPQKAGRRRR